MSGVDYTSILKEIISDSEQSIVLINKNGSLNVCLPPDSPKVYSFGDALHIFGIYEDEELTEFNKSKKLFHFNEETGVYHLNRTSVEYLAHDVGIDVPGVDFEPNELAKNNRYIGESIEWNAKKGKITLNNQKRGVFERQLSDRVFCISSEYDNLSTLEDTLKEAKFKNNKHFICANKDEYKPANNIFFSAAGLKRLISECSLNFKNTNDFEGKFALMRNIFNKSIGVSRNWTERVLSRMNDVLGNEKLSLNGSIGFAEDPNYALVERLKREAKERKQGRASDDGVSYN